MEKITFTFKEALKLLKEGKAKKFVAEEKGAKYYLAMRKDPFSPEDNTRYATIYYFPVENKSEDDAPEEKEDLFFAEYVNETHFEFEAIGEEMVFRKIE